jgi:putative ABC transport system ATP-binding protein
MEARTPLIELNNVSLAHNLGKENEVWSLQDVSVEIYPQEHVIFFGPSGCGKSSLLNTIAGLERPTKGTVKVSNQNLTEMPDQDMIKYHQSTIGMVFQAYMLIPHLTARDNINLPQLFARKNRAARTQKTEELMDRFGIVDFQHRRPAMLSGGQQQRVAIARALANDPLVLLADEPAGNLDSNNTYIVLNLLSEFKNEDRKTIVHVTHDPNQLHYADRVFYMKDGKVVKIVVNPKPGIQKRKEITEFEVLEQSYPYLKQSEISARILLNRLTTPFGIETRHLIEEAISSYMEGTIDEKELLYLLDQKPIDLYKQTAQDMARDIIEYVAHINALKDTDSIDKNLPPLEKAQRIRSFVLSKYSGVLTMEQVRRMDEVIVKRIEGKITAHGLKDLLDIPYKKGGVGLNVRTAANFKRDIEVLLMKKK